MKEAQGRLMLETEQVVGNSHLGIIETIAKDVKLRAAISTRDE